MTGYEIDESIILGTNRLVRIRILRYYANQGEEKLGGHATIVRLEYNVPANVQR